MSIPDKFKNLNPSALWMPNNELGDGLISLKILFSKLKKESDLWMWISSLFDSHITFGKKEYEKQLA